MKTVLWIILMFFNVMVVLCMVLLAYAIYLSIKKRYIPRFPWKKMCNY